MFTSIKKAWATFEHYLSVPERVKVLYSNTKACEWRQVNGERGAWIHETAVVWNEGCLGRGAIIGPSAWVMDGARVEADAHVGEGATVGERAKMRSGSTLLAGVHMGYDSVLAHGMTARRDILSREVVDCF